MHDALHGTYAQCSQDVDMDTKYEGEEDELYDKAALILDFSRKKKLRQQRC